MLRLLVQFINKCKYFESGLRLKLGAGRSFEVKVANFCHQASGRRLAMRAARALPGGGDFGGVSQTRIVLKLSPN